LWILKQIWKTTCVTPTKKNSRGSAVLLNDPRAGLGNLGDRLKQFDRSTLVALLSQREDITEESADQIESVRNSFVEQLQKVQQTIQSAIDGILTESGTTLTRLSVQNSTMRGIQQDFQKVFDGWI